MRNNITTIYDVLNTLVQSSIVGVVIGIFLGKWIERRHENDKLKREIYLEANRALSRFKDSYLLLANTNFKDEKMYQSNEHRFYKQHMLTEDAKSDLEIIGSDKAVELYIKCLNYIVQAVKEIQSKKQKGETAVNIANNITEIPSWNNFLNSWCKWNNIVREDLKIIKK